MKGFSVYFIALALFFLPMQVFGTHAMGTDITYECLGNNQYRVTVVLYRDCSGIPAPTSVNLEYFSPSCNTSSSSINLVLQSSQEVSPLCPSQIPNSTCNGGFYPGVEQYIYEAVVTLPQQCPDWVLGFRECCRNDVDNLAGAQGYYLYAYATVNNTGGLCDNSPQFTTLPVPYICAGVPFNYNQGAIDIDGDSLVYSMIQPLDDYNAPIAYAGSYNVDSPMTTTGSFQFDTITGQMSFTPSIPQVDVVTVQVKAYRNGVLVGSTMRDIQVVILANFLCTNQTPNISPISNVSGGGFIDSSTIQMCPNTQLTFDIVVSDNNGDVITLTSNAPIGSGGAIPGSSFTVTSTSSGVKGTFSWTPTAADVGFHPFQVTYFDNGCPVSSPQTVTFVIYVFDEVVASADQVYCGDTIKLNAIGGSYFTWAPSAGLSATNISNPKATPTVPTYYTVTSDCGVDTVFVDVRPPYTLDAGSDTSICLNAIAQLNATPVPATYGPYSYEWAPATGLSTTTISNPIASPASRTCYAVKSTSADGCVKRDTVCVSISGVAPSVTAFASKDTVCPGERIQLGLTTIPSNCGVSITPCNTTPLDYTLGTTLQSTGTGTPYEGFWEDGRVQFLYRASELNAMGVAGGKITQIAFNITDKTSTAPYSGFTIKMGCTSLSVLSSFVPNLAPVYGPTAYTSSPGWNTHILTAGYDWDGVSNVIVEVCFDNNTFTGDDDISYTVTPFVSVAYDFADQGSGCTLAGPTTSRNRPNTRFSICQQSITNATISWQPSAGMNPNNVPNPFVRVFGTTTFIVDVDEGGCVGQGFASVVVDTTIVVEAEGDTSLCLPEPVQLTSTAYGVPSPILLTCGVNGTPAASPGTYTLGTGTSVTTTPTPFKGTFHDNRVQMLVRESEISAMGLERGVFSSISFNVAFKNSTQPFRGFTIKMGCTNSDVIGNAFDPNLSIVYTPKDVTTTTGWNSFTLDNTFDWDGFSNLLVEICFNNIGYAGDDIVNFTATSFPSAIHASADWLAGCNLTNGTQTNSRPDMRFGISTPPLATFTYAWSPGTALSDATAPNPVSTATSTTTYVVTVTDGICVATDSVLIRFYTGYDVNVFGQNIGCNGNSDGNAVSIPNGGVAPYDFSWNNGAQVATGVLTDTLFNLNAGVYYVTVTDKNGCDANDSIIITVPPPLSVSTVSYNVSCFGGSNGVATATGAGGTSPYRYSWSNGDNLPSADSLSANSYSVILTDNSGCLAYDTVTVIEPTAITSSIAVTDVSCYKYEDGTATVSASGGTPPYAYLWVDAQMDATATDLEAGTYTVTITDDSNCVHLDTANVGQPDSLGILIDATDVSCYNGSDGSASASVQGDSVNYEFRWDTNPPQNTPTATRLPAGAVLLQVTDTNGCIINSVAAIGSPAQILLAASAADASCFDGADGSAEVHVVAGGTSPFTYAWNIAVSDSNISGVAADTYYVTVTDANGCNDFDTVVVSEPARMAIYDSIIPVSCFGLTDGRILATVSGGTPSFSFLWSNGDTTPIADFLGAGDYKVIVTDLNGCVDSLTGITVTEPTPVLFGDIDVTRPCAGEPTGAVLTSADGGTAPYNFTLSGISGTIVTTDGNFTGLPADTFTLVASDQKGCTIDTFVEVVAFDSVHVAFDSSEIKINLGQEVTLDPIVQPANSMYSYSWEPSTNLSCTGCLNPIAAPLITTPYEITVFDENGCRYSETIIIEVDNELILLVPNAFSPNGDGVNDYLNVYGISIASVEFSVFNRWGTKLFETNNLNEGWDGSFRNKPLPPDVYVYYVDAVFTDGQKKQIKGSTTILK